MIDPVKFKFINNEVVLNFSSTKKKIIQPPDIEIQCECNNLKNTGKKIILLFTNGDDSSMLFNSFVKNNVDFKCLTLKFNDNKNIHDIDKTFKICNENGIEHEIFKFDLNNFYYVIKDCQEKNYVYSEITNYLIQHIIDSCIDEKSLCITGQGAELKIINKKFLFSFSNSLLLENNTNKLYNLTSPYYILSYLKNNDVQNNLSQLRDIKSFYLFRSFFYKKYFNVSNTSPKTHGFEKVSQSDILLWNKLITDKYNEVYSAHSGVSQSVNIDSLKLTLQKMVDKEYEKSTYLS